MKNNISNTASADDVKILYLDRHFCVVRKPKGILVVKNHPDESDLISRVKKHLEQLNAPKKTYIQPLHFLDRDVGGVVMFALSTKAASRISEDIRERKVKKFYRAQVCVSEDKLDFFSEEVRDIHNFMVEDPSQAGRMLVVEKDQSAKVQKAHLRVRLVSKKPWIRSQKSSKNRDSGLVNRYVAMLEVELITGRKHQIRATLAHLGAPILGDPWYGVALASRQKRVSLIATRIIFYHPIDRQKLIDVKVY